MVFEPQERPIIDQFFQRLMKNYNMSREDIEDAIFWMVDGATMVSEVVDRFMGGGLGNWYPTFLKRMVPGLIRYFRKKRG